MRQIRDYTLLVNLDHLPPLKAMQMAESIDKTIRQPVTIRDGNGNVLFDTATDSGARVVYRK